MTNDIYKEYNEGIKYELYEPKLTNEEIEIYKNLPQLSFSFVNILLNAGENEIKLKMKVPICSCYNLKFTNIEKIYFFTEIGEIKYTSYELTTKSCISLAKDEILFIYIKAIKDNENIFMDISENHHLIFLPYQPLEINKDYDKSYINEDPLKPFEITYIKRKGEALYINCNNPEHLNINQLNKGLQRNKFSDKEVFFTMSHFSDVDKKTYIGYQVRNIGKADLFITIKNIGLHIGEHGWYGEKEWIDFYNVKFRIRNREKWKNDEFKKINNEYPDKKDEDKNVQDIYEPEFKPYTTYRIPPGKHIYVLGVLLLMLLIILMFLKLQI